jgi:hypothetical protein
VCYICDMETNITSCWISVVRNGYEACFEIDNQTIAYHFNDPRIYRRWKYLNSEGAFEEADNLLIEHFLHLISIELCEID